MDSRVRGNDGEGCDGARGGGTSPGMRPENAPACLGVIPAKVEIRLPFALEIAMDSRVRGNDGEGCGSARVWVGRRLGRSPGTLRPSLASFPRKREFNGPSAPRSPWVLACAGMTVRGVAALGCGWSVAWEKARERSGLPWRHSRESGNPIASPSRSPWIPACAGTTVRGVAALGCGWSVAWDGARERSGLPWRHSAEAGIQWPISPKITMDSRVRGNVGGGCGSAPGLMERCPDGASELRPPLASFPRKRESNGSSPSRPPWFGAFAGTTGVGAGMAKEARAEVAPGRPRLRRRAPAPGRHINSLRTFTSASTNASTSSRVL